MCCRGAGRGRGFGEYAQIDRLAIGCVALPGEQQELRRSCRGRRKGRIQGREGPTNVSVAGKAMRETICGGFGFGWQHRRIPGFGNVDWPGL